MIRHAQKCFCCRVPTTHTAVVDGELVYLCPRCPTPAEIRVRCREVQARWTPSQWATREHCCLTDQVDARRAVFYDRLYRVVVDGRGGDD